jgi:hypothetical protein
MAQLKLCCLAGNFSSGRPVCFAPAIVRAGSLMPVRGLIVPINTPESSLPSATPQEGFVRRLLFASCDSNLKAGRTKSSFGFNRGRLSEVEMRDLVAYARKNGFLKQV